jgi:hypothetical protein
VSSIFLAYAIALNRHQVWTSVGFQKISLKEMGLRVQLGHHDLTPCTYRDPQDYFVVAHLNGYHEVAVDFCRCPHVVTAGQPHTQLLRHRWFPATHFSPKSAFTFEVLRLYHILATQARVNHYDFSITLERATDNSGVEQVYDRRRDFVRVHREWKYLKMLKRGGRGNEDDGVIGVSPGELAVQCIACPRPGINLPDGWKTDPMTFVLIT